MYKTAFLRTICISSAMTPLRNACTRPGEMSHVAGYVRKWVTDYKASYLCRVILG